MRKCNVCGKKRSNWQYATPAKLTCKKCERTWWRTFLRFLVKQRQLTATERLANRLGYMGTAFIMMSPYLLKYDDLGAYTYLIGAILSIPQVFLAKQWNLVVVNINLLVGYGAYLLNA
tara:strand:+ start:896 stop:1249 length:354 start_codon:yes stop_codon:yes gene_type:complete